MTASAAESFLDGKITLRPGDCLDVLKTLPPNSVDAIVTDPPYHLTTNKKGGTGAASVNLYSPYGRARIGTGNGAGGFMGKAWDGGDIAFRVELWAEVFRVLKPGGHVAAFGGTRTIHRMACAIEDAGFEIRDQLQWLYGSGFPKSLDVSKAIDKAAGAERQVVGTKTITGRNGDAFGQGPGQHQTRFKSGDISITEAATEAAKQWDGFGTALKPACEPICLARKPLIGTVAENVLQHGTGALNIDGCRVRVDTWAQEDDRWCSCAERAGSSAKLETSETRESTATKNVGLTSNDGQKSRLDVISKTDIGCSVGLKAVNTDTNSSTEEFGNERTDPSPKDTRSTTRTSTGPTTTPTTCTCCGKLITADFTNKSMPIEPPGSQPVETPQSPIGRGNEPSANKRYTDNGSTNFAATPGPRGGAPQGRWPANVIHDGSDEVVGAFPQTSSGLYKPSHGDNGKGAGILGAMNGRDRDAETYGDSGSAARFFYTAKADADDRLGSKHPTVKPLDLMQWLVRLVTPPGGLVLDPFAGTGTTGEAAFREGMRAVLIEREPEYQNDIRRRMAHAMAGPEERKRTIAKIKNPNPVNDGLFALLPSNLAETPEISPNTKAGLSQ